MKSRTVDTDDLVSLFREAVVDNCLIHRFSFAEAAGAFDLLYNNMDEALGVLLDWQR